MGPFLVALILAAPVGHAPAGRPPIVPVPGRAASIAHRISLGGEGGWDLMAVDTLTHRLFVSRGTRVQVVDLLRDTLAGEIPDTPGVHGIAIAADLGRGYTTNGRDSSVTVFDLRSLAPLRRVRVTGRNPDAIVYDPSTRRVLAMNAGSGSATVLVAGPDTVAGTIALGGAPEMAVADGRGHVYVNLEDSSRVVAVDPVAMKTIASYTLAPGEGPTGLALDRAHRRLFAGCHNRLMVILDADSGARVDTLGIGSGVDGVDFDPEPSLAFSSNGEGTLTIVREDDPNHFTTLAQFPTQRGARTLAVDPTTHHVYLATAEFGPPPAPTPERPHPRRSIVPGTFVILDVVP